MEDTPAFLDHQFELSQGFIHLYINFVANITFTTGCMNSKNTSFSTKKPIVVNGKELTFEVPRIMGILNITPDSFYDGGRYSTLDKAIERVEQMLVEGADLIDIGAVSTRPGSKGITSHEEAEKLIPVLQMIRRVFPTTIISVDTYNADTAKQAIEHGADIINDISGGTFDRDMIPLISKHDVGFIIMHIQGTPENMQKDPQYGDVVYEVREFLFDQARKTSQAGNPNVIIDPGFGFGKTLEQNYKMLHELHLFHEGGWPVMAGLSRKSMINRLLGITPEEALNGTTVLNTLAIMKGADILRVHDVNEAREVVEIIRFLSGVAR